MHYKHHIMIYGHEQADHYKQFIITSITLLQAPHHNNDTSRQTITNTTSLQASRYYKHLITTDRHEQAHHYRPHIITSITLLQAAHHYIQTWTGTPLHTQSRYYKQHITVYRHEQAHIFNINPGAVESATRSPFCRLSEGRGCEDVNTRR